MSKILIIEDDPYVRRFYERLFRVEEHEVKMAKDGEEGLFLVNSFKPDLILLDIIMPVMNGLDVLKELKSKPETKDISVVMLTNIDDHETMQMAVKLGAQSFVVKAKVPPEQLQKLVDNKLEETQKTVV